MNFIPVTAPQAVAFHAQTGEEGVFIRSDGTAEIRLKFPSNVNRVEIVFPSGETIPFEQKEELWTAEMNGKSGFHYVQIKVNVIDTLSPYLPVGYGYSHPVNFIDFPDRNSCSPMPSSLPRGSVERRFYYSGLTEKWESFLVYLPPDYFVSQKQYPVLYLQHGHGENETGWMYHGRVHEQIDLMIAQKRARPMLVVMCNGMVEKNGTVDTLCFPDLLVREIIPYVDTHFRTCADRNSRAMAGLSMGSMHTSMTVLLHPDLFAYAGLFSGFLRYIWNEDEQPHLKFLDDAEKFRKSFKVFFRAMGENDGFLEYFLADDALVASKGLQDAMIRKIYPGSHEWNVWRNCLYDFVPLLFQDEE